jgi:hypothetical protein
MWTWITGIVPLYSKYKNFLLPIAGIALFIGGLFVGRMGNPEKIVFKDRIEEVIVEKIVIQEHVVEKKVYVQAKKEKTRKETTTTKAPDGTETTKTVEETHTDTDTHENEDKTTERIVYQEKIVERIVEREKLVLSSQPDWRIAAGAGVSIPTTFLGKSEIGVPGLRGAVIQLEIDRRIIGPFSMGVFGNTQGVVGLTISGQF